MEITSLEYFRFVMFLALLSTSGFAPHFFALMLSTLLNIYFITLLFVYVYFSAAILPILWQTGVPLFETTIAWSSYLNSYAMYRTFLIKFIAQCTSFRRHQRTMRVVRFLSRFMIFSESVFASASMRRGCLNCCFSFAQKLL